MSNMRETSLLAFKELKKRKLGKQEAELLGWLRIHPHSTNMELHKISGMGINAVSGRMNGLVKKKYAVTTGTRTCRVTGHEAHAWVALK